MEKGVSEVSAIENREELIMVREQLGIRNSDVYGSDSVIFLEGESESVAFRIILPALGYRQIGRGIRLFNLNGKDNLVKLKHFLYCLKSHDTRSFIIADADERVRIEFESFIREGLLKKDHYKMWDADFEDLFENDLIIRAMQRISQNQGFKFDMTTDEIQQERKKPRKVADILRQYMYCTNNTCLNKPLLAKEPVDGVVREIYSGKERQETRFEKEIKMIMDIILQDIG